MANAIMKEVEAERTPLEELLTWAKASLSLYPHSLDLPSILALYIN